MKKPALAKLVPLFGACVVATVFTALAFYNNCVVIARWWKAFFACGGDTAAMAEQTITGCLPWLDWTAVDHSAATTFIPLLGFSFMTLSVVRMMCGKRVNAEDFPFFKGSDQLNVALGLFGTLWGIIVIGYFNLDTVGMADLMQCLHTALFSTLMAVVWVFLFDRPLVRPFFLKLLDGTNLIESDEGDLNEAIDRLIARLGEASDAFDARQARFEKAFCARQEAFETAVAEREKAANEAITKWQTTAEEGLAARQTKADEFFKKRMDEMDDFYTKRLEAYALEFEARQKEYVEVFRRRIDELQSRAAESQARAEAATARLDAVTKALHQ